jgi:hypothetical protein
METHASLVSEGLAILYIRAEDSFAAAHAAMHIEDAPAQAVLSPRTTRR